MEFPGGWSALVASLAVAQLDDPDYVWRFLREGDLVSNRSDGVEVLRAAIGAERPRRITGGSLASRIADHLTAAHLTASAAAEPDPFAQLAQRRWTAFAEANGLSALPNEEL